MAEYRLAPAFSDVSSESKRCAFTTALSFLLTLALGYFSDYESVARHADHCFPYKRASQLINAGT